MKTVYNVMLSAALAACFAAPMAAQAKEPAATMNTPAASALNKADQAIIKKMAQANINEVEAGKLAVSKAQAADVKAFAQQMVDDHTKALGDVTTLAQAKGVTLPTAPDAKHKAMAAKLSKLDGAAFDKAYMAQAGVSDHTMVHKALKADESRAKDADVKALAGKMLPTVEQHLHSATEMKAGAKAAAK
jgi:putative membrane protein